jgi:hypothetical protein
MAVEERAEELPAVDVSRVVGSPRRHRWQRVVRLGSLVALLAALVLVAVVGYHLVTTHHTWDPMRSGDELVLVLLGLLVAVMSLAVLVFRPECGQLRSLIWTTAIWSVAMLVVLGCVWYLIDSGVREDIAVGTPMRSQADVDSYLANRLLAEGDGAALIPIPTGVMIQSVEFLNANNVQVTGFIWQKYADSVPADITRGFVLPEAVDEAYQADKAYTDKENGVELIGWYFHATLRQAFDYRNYPFDRQDVWLRIWHPDFNRRVILVPDLASYPDINPLSLPGLDPQFVYGGWTPEFSDFSYAINVYNTSFGYPANHDRGAFPELYFNLGLERDFKGPFFDHVVLSLAVALLLFIILLLTTNDDDLQKRFGLTTAGVAALASGLLFAVILKHNQIRAAVGSQRTAYLEVLPFILYFAILFVALNAILLASPIKVRLVEYK